MLRSPSIALLVLPLCLCLLAAVSPALCVTPRLGDASDDKIPNQGHAKARLITCVGPCMAKYPNIKKFVADYGFKLESFEVLFIGSKPDLIVFDDDGSKYRVENVLEMTTHEIFTFLTTARGLRLK